MQLEHRFTVPARVDDTWAAFNDLERIAPCFPGASLTAYDGDSFEGICKVKLGPVSLHYAGAGSFIERDVEGKRAVIQAKGKDKRGNGTAAATIVAELTANGDVTDVAVTTDLSITGRPAQFGRGVIQDVSDKLLAQFAVCLETKLAGPTEVAEPATAGVSSVEAAAGPASAANVAAVSEEEAGPAVSGTAAGPTATGAAAGPTAARAAAETAPRGAAELDLGAALLPSMMKRYAPYLVGLVVAVLVLRRLLGRRR
jgi:uncharacterized protein